MDKVKSVSASFFINFSFISVGNFSLRFVTVQWHINLVIKTIISSNGENSKLLDIQNCTLCGVCFAHQESTF